MKVDRVGFEPTPSALYNLSKRADDERESTADQIPPAPLFFFLNALHSSLYRQAKSWES
jgi:hypothetical protein